MVTGEMKNSEPLAMFKKLRNSFPVLAAVAVSTLHINPSEAPAERLFSIAGRVMRPDRSSLSASRQEQLAFLRGNKKK